MDALDLTAAGWRASALRRNNTHDLRSRLSPGRRLARHRRYRMCDDRLRLIRRDGHHGAAPASEPSQFFDYLRCRGGRKPVADSAFWSNGRGLRHSDSLCRARCSALLRPSPRLRMAEPMAKHPSTCPYGHRRLYPGTALPSVFARNRRPVDRRSGVSRDLWRWMAASPTIEQPGLMKHVFLTGASSGIGLAIAKLLVAQGHEVWGTSRNLERLTKIPRWHPVRLDLADRFSVQEAFKSALAEAGYFDVLINNAGAGHFGPAELLSMEIIASQFQILVFGQIEIMQLALRHMQTR